jgi:hypothetical protein
MVTRVRGKQLRCFDEGRCLQPHARTRRLRIQLTELGLLLRRADGFSESPKVTQTSWAHAKMRLD